MRTITWNRAWKKTVIFSHTQLCFPKQEKKRVSVVIHNLSLLMLRKTWSLTNDTLTSVIKSHYFCKMCESEYWLNFLTSPIIFFVSFIFIQIAGTFLRRSILSLFIKSKKSRYIFFKKSSFITTLPPFDLKDYQNLKNNYGYKIFKCQTQELYIKPHPNMRRIYIS